MDAGLGGLGALRPKLPEPARSSPTAVLSSAPLQRAHAAEGQASFQPLGALDRAPQKQTPRGLQGGPAACCLAGGPIMLCLHALARGRRRARGRHGFRLRRLATTPYPSGRYNPASAAEYFQGKPLSVIARALELATAGLSFGLQLLADKQFDTVEANESKRARTLTDLLTRLGPTFIKIGQAVSIRADLLSPAYLTALVELQDCVPPFPTQEADKILETELGQPIGQVFEEISVEPIASASLGQVYRGRLVDGPEVAVKVQRPGMEEVIALDLHLLRSSAGPVKQVLSIIAPVNQDLVGLIDAWGAGFVAELDYRAEAANAERFLEAIDRTPLRDAVCAPPAIASCTTSKVLTTEWIVGTRLEKSTAADVTQLCSVAMNSYLTMMLEFGTIHADPHPGNLLRTTSGQLCILDWGLVASVTPKQQIALIEHVANLVSRDYRKLPHELAQLGFVPEGKEKEVGESEVVDVLSGIYSEWTDGGGAASVDLNKFVQELQGLNSKYGSLFRVPPWFFYIARAFVVLEGIGVSNDARYSVVTECLPYISRRLLNDQSPRVAKALGKFVYGDTKGQVNQQILTEKVENLGAGFSSYMRATTGLSTSKSPGTEASNLVEQMAELLIGAPESNGLPTPFQAIVLDELAKVLGAGARNLFASTGIFPRPQGVDANDARWSVVQPDEADRQTLKTAERLTMLAQPRMQAQLDAFLALPADERVSVARQVLAKLWEYRAGVAVTGGRLAAKLFSQGLTRLGNDLLSPSRRIENNDKSVSA